MKRKQIHEINDIELVEQLIKNGQQVPMQISENLDPQENSQGISGYEKKMITFFLLLYFIQGIPIGFFIYGCPILLAEGGAKFTELAILSIGIYPFSFKILTAPILDTYYLQSIGRRRTYILPIQYTISLIFFVMGYLDFQNLVKQNQIYTIAFLGFAVMFLTAHQDIAVDGWVLSSLRFHNVHYGSTCQSIGQIIGVFFGSTVMVLITSQSFAQNFSDKSESLLSLNQFCMLSAVIILVINIFVHIFTSESIELDSQQLSQQTFFNTMRELKQILSIKNVQLIIAFFITYQLGFRTVVASSAPKLIQSGFPKEIISSVQTISIPFSILISVYVSKNLKIGKETFWILNLIKVRYLDCFIQFLIVLHFQSSQQVTTLNTIIIFLSLLSTYSLNQAFMVTNGCFFNRIADPLIGATYLTLLNSCINLGLAKLSESLSLTLIGLFGYEVTVIFGWFIGILHFFLFNTPFLKLTTENIESWRVKK